MNHDTNSVRIAQLHASLLHDIARRMSTPGKWIGVPGLLDELHALRRQFDFIGGSKAHGQQPSVRQERVAANGS
jgi:hypothetical protein